MSWCSESCVRSAWVLICLVALGLSVGCRKSATELLEEQHEESEAFLEAQWQFQQSEARARNLYYQGKEMHRQDRYKEAVEAWAAAIAADEQVGLMVDLAKNIMASEMLEVAHYRMHRPYEDRTFARTSREMIDLILDEENGFLEKHVKKANEELREWNWIKGGWEAYDRAQGHIKAHQLAKGLDILEEICQDYPRTPLADRCIVLLKQYGR